MLSPKENDYLCRVGPVTPMGNMLREILDARLFGFGYR